MGREAYRSPRDDLAKPVYDSLLRYTTVYSETKPGIMGDDDELFQLLLAAADRVDHYCNRHFYPRTAMLVFYGKGTSQLLFPDLIAVTSLKRR